MKIELTNEEALVLFHWLNNNARRNEVFQDKSEQIVLWSMECQLEKNLLEPHSDQYLQALKSAQADIKRTYSEITDE